ncbi:putative transcription factor GRAS family [Medicago truncatula]|uniref:GRAS family protein RAD1 n=2 Tax=Medicago truncatula TaxID=3880 RepID=RAD1_MEDTR|nr:RecName: Full=GRAS family protein RAD1; AltName: Full=Protein REQUIRED FOR ARBUSCULE DEVELOPMENT 1; Short=MtRAD1 [Medicago truncatula]AES91080.1 GRAS family transcription factor [Medicago truncatula]RHN63401.1 putative transcription factor GRAS family [Medicago truncatula]
MSPALYASTFKCEVDENPSLMGSYYASLYPNLPILENSATSTWILNPFSDHETETIRDHKKLKRSTVTIPIWFANFSSHSNSFFNNINSNNNSVNSIPRLHFRDHIRTYKQRYFASEAVEEAAEDNFNYNNCEAEEDGSCADGMRLVQLLIACAEAVACRDKSHASVLLSELKSNALVFGSSFQRVASCFVQGLTERLTLIQPIGNNSAGSDTKSMMNIMDAASEEMEEAFKLVYENCPHIQFGHFVANSIILEAFEGESFLHVVDLGMSLGLPHGHQWRGLIQSLADRSSHRVRRLRITAIGLCIARIQVIGEELSIYAKNLGIHLEFSIVEKNLENLKPKDIKVNEKEVLVVNSILQLHCVVKESRGALNAVLQMIHGLSPKVLVMAEQDSGHNGPFFLGRFMESLHYYSAIFDSLDAMLPKYDTKRAKMEQFYFAEEIKNIVSCEGPLRMERHEKVDQWRRRMSRAGFQGSPIKMVVQAKQWLVKNNVCDGYTVVEEKGCLVLGWKSKPIVAVSCWKC